MKARPHDCVQLLNAISYTFYSCRIEPFIDFKRDETFVKAGKNTKIDVRPKTQLNFMT